MNFSLPTTLLLSLILPACAFKILIYTNLFGHSHVKVMAAVADTLTDAGHNVTVLMPIIESQFINKTSLKSTKNIIFVEQTEHLKELMSQRTGRFGAVWTVDNSNPLNMIKKSKMMSSLFSEHCSNVMAQKELIEKFQLENFDIAITEPFDTCAYAFFEAIRIRCHVAVYSCARLDHVSDVIGQPTPHSYVPGMQSTFGDKMNLWQRFLNFLQFRGSSYIFSSIGDADLHVAKQYYPEIRSWREVLPEASFIFTNQIPLLDFPAPTFDKIVPVGGLSVKTDKKSLKLEEKWDKILGLREKNVFISFGSNARSVDMPEVYKLSLFRVFQSMPSTTFIWKYEEPHHSPFPEPLPKVYLSDWLPQNELLADARLSLFVTHGGLASVMELAVMGKPAVMIPLVADQARNAEMLKRHGGAAVLSKFDLEHPDIVRKVLEDVIHDDSYLSNAQRLAEMISALPTNPKDTLLKYVEFAARFGKLPSLDNYGRHQGYIEYFFLDIIAISLVTVAVILYVTLKTGKWAIGKCFGGKRKVE